MQFTSLSTMEPKEIFDTFKYIEKFANEDENKRDYALSKIGCFFTDITMEQEIELYIILENEDYFAMKDFMKRNPTMKFNGDGDNKPLKHDPWETKEMSLNTSYESAKKNINSTTKQFIDARELNCLKTIKEFPYWFEKNKVLKEYQLPINFASNLAKYEEIAAVDIKRFLALVLEYTKMNPKKTRFIEYVSYYLDVVRLDTECRSELTKEYIKNINDVLEYFDNKRK